MFFFGIIKTRWRIGSHYLILEHFFITTNVIDYLKKIFPKMNYMDRFHITWFVTKLIKSFTFSQKISKSFFKSWSQYYTSFHQTKRSHRMATKRVSCDDLVIEIFNHSWQVHLSWLSVSSLPLILSKISENSQVLWNQLFI